MLKNIVVPEVKDRWDHLAISMDYQGAEINAIRRDGQNVDDQCVKLFQDWLDTDHGCTPKTWQTLIERIEEDGLHAAVKRIKEKLLNIR